MGLFRQIWPVVGLAGLVGCATLAKVPNALADLDTFTIPVHFFGQHAELNGLYVCGLKEKQLNCIDYETFETAVKK